MIIPIGIAFLACAVLYVCRHQAIRALEKPVNLLFHYFYYRDGEKTWTKTNWLGVPLMKLPLDMWRYNDILWETRPDLIVETGTFRGGSALYLANLCDLMGNGRIVTVDLSRQPEGVPEHPRIQYVLGSSTDAAIFDHVKRQIQPGERVMVILDSDHSCSHVRKELSLYAPLVTEGCYLVVEDTNVNGHPVSRSHGPGPMEAMRDFLSTPRGFQTDVALEERYKCTFFPGGWLKRTSA
ncbi:MAG: class I SAM-dependent methyltransferase [Candidatus Solibacter usitatus]|nr:class I SAM-dependent methyltransferase [Candidatus Solibacter usitatus]